MAESLTISGQLTAGPSSATDGTFPDGSTVIPFSTSPSPKPYNSDTGKNVRTITSPSSFIELVNLGADGDVTQAHTVELRTSAPMTLRVTTRDPNGGADVVAVLPVAGMWLHEFPTNATLKKLEVMGSGTLQYYGAGNS